MEREIYFSKLSGIGDLFLDYVFNEFDFEPILFTVRKSSKKLYICLCYEFRDSLEWIASPVDSELIRKLIHKEIDIKQFFLNSGNLFKIIKNSDGSYIVQKISEDSASELLPRNGLFLRCDFEAAQDYLTELNSVDSFMLAVDFMSSPKEDIFANIFDEIEQQVSYSKEISYNNCSDDSESKFTADEKTIFAA